MKRIVVFVLLLCVVAAPVIAADLVTVKSKMGDVTFNHKAHGEKAECKTCHGEAAPGKFSLGGKDAAHKLCQDCHKTKGGGPTTKCMECHKKK